MKKLVQCVIAVSAVAFAGFADAHTAYMKPTAFYTNDTHVTVQAAYATQFFTPAIGLNSPTFAVVGPDGRLTGFANMAIDAQSGVLDASTNARGTYRMTTGERIGDIVQLVGDGNGGWRPLTAGETPAEGAPTTTLQTVTVAETYVTKGVPNRTAVDAPSGRLNIHPITHPNQVLVASGFELELLLDGHPFPNMPFVLYDSGDPETKVDHTFVTNDQGRATLTFDHPGTYMVAVRYRGPAPADSGAAVRSYTSTLTFDVMTALPPPPPPERGERRRPSF